MIHSFRLCPKIVLFSETLNLGNRLGLDPAVLSQIINAASGRCWSSDTYNPVPGVIETVPSSNGYKGGFGTTLMTKVCSKFQAIMFFYKKSFFRIWDLPKMPPPHLNHQFHLDQSPIRLIAKWVRIQSLLIKIFHQPTHFYPKKIWFQMNHEYLWCRQNSA